MYRMPLKEYQNQELLNPKKSKKKTKIIFLLFIILGIYGFFNIFVKPKEIVVEQEVEDIATEKQAEDENVVYYTIAEGDIPAEIFSTYGNFNANDTAALLSAAEETYDFTNIKIGNKLRFYFKNHAQNASHNEEGEDERAERMEYDRDTEEMIILERHGDDFDVHKRKIPYEVSQEIVSGKIDNFFYVDAMDAGLSEATVLEIGDLFSFSIDFTTEIRQGDTFDVIYEKRTRNKQDAPDGKILAAKFVNEGTAHYAYYFNNDGEDGYYDQDGYILERQFLRAPLSYRRITSGFTGARLHPITRTVTAHYQIDYAAPIGTPIVATARGTIVSAGWEGGWGYMIRARHDNGYTTHYGHLSSFADGIGSGVQVSQGQVIGYVGSTGWSTGPHLDYGMKLKGVPVNPLKLDLPKGNPLSEDKMEKFEEVKNQYANLLE